jgi:rubredoxin-NAD+ reductase
MAIWVCDVCGWEYNEAEGYPDGGIAAGTKFEDLPDDFECPMCGAGKDEFTKA